MYLIHRDCSIFILGFKHSFGSDAKNGLSLAILICLMHPQV